MSDIDDNTIFTTELSEDEEKMLEEPAAVQLTEDLLRRHEEHEKHDAKLVAGFPLQPRA
ncbi:hypothetical protein [Agreia sp. COWG]|uniref:hypothetical protein n=1 Tax=Agreia sp. COWG TaxID=2773266 RepID=UPI001925FD46|nr:hypothetical protein [Agreia sp. COWG]CAD6015812.1 protein of unknown function [Agreia sp. COWG]